MGYSSRYEYYAWILFMTMGLLEFLPVSTSAGLAAYVRPFCWSVLIAWVVFMIPRVYAPGLLHVQDMIMGYAGSGAVIYLALSFLLAAFLKELAATPYDLSPAGIVHNLISILPGVAAKELIREYGLGTAWRKPRFRHVFAGAITIFMAVLEINYGKAASVSDAKAWFIFYAKDVIPLFSKNILLSILVLYGGARAGILYSGIIQVFQRIFPFLPNLPWLADSAIGIAFPVLYSVFIHERYCGITGSKPSDSKEGLAGYLATLFFSVGFCWFCVGVFSVYPSVVLTGSMEPGIRPGDAVLIRKVQSEKEMYQLKTGDVITFTRGGITITHRILETLYDEAGNVSFRTKGDNNKSPDNETVFPQDIKGIVIGNVPKAGIPVLLIKSGEKIPEGVVDHEEEDY
ncbi:signal peptidase I [Lacrimispora indolis]|uniref:signal peptidase I n=1 Tax=Lacrimispora indolis TaxID=69825 RepID=UPI00045E73C8|nr:signal peptidase I [Lacrimispora indolis]